MTKRMIQILEVLHKEDMSFMSGGRGNGSLTPNQIGMALGFDNGMEGNRISHNGRRMGPANRVNFALTRLRTLGLIDFGARADGNSGTAYGITAAGKAKLQAR